MNDDYIFLEQPRRGKTREAQITPYKRSAVWGLSLTILLWVCAVHAHAQHVYVSASATDDSGAGTSWETAKQTIAAGLAAAGGSGTVFVMAGSYSTDAELMIPAGVTVMGGYEPSSMGTDTSQRNLPGANLHWNNSSWCTIITGSGTHRIATVNGMLDGCVIRHGFTNTYGGGVLIDGGTVRYCVIKECDAIDDEDGVAEGGGAYVQNNGTLLNCVVTECRGDKGAGVAGGNGSLISNTITRNRPIDCGIVSDYDGNLYKTVVIGDQCWMRENLRTTHYSDGTLIAEGTTTSTTVAYRYRGYLSEAQHQLDPSNFVRCGYLYNWTAVMHGAASSNSIPSGVQGVCPNGWHLPSQAEWMKLITYAQGVPKFWCNGNSAYIGKAFASKVNWQNYNTDCYTGNNAETNNATRFSAQTTGSYNGSYIGYGQWARILSCTEYNASTAYRISFDYNAREYNLNNQTKSNGYAVRCLKD